MASKPTTPKEIVEKRGESLPDAVFDSFNEILAKEFNGNFARVWQKEVMGLMIQKGLSHQEIFDKHYLDVENAYEAAGWKVEYEKPGYDESFDAYFVFTRKRQKS